MYNTKNISEAYKAKSFSAAYVHYQKGLRAMEVRYPFLVGNVLMTPKFDNNETLGYFRIRLEHVLYATHPPVSYTHLTLPTICSV